VSNVVPPLLTPCSKVLIEKLTVTWMVKKFLSFYGTRRFITVFTRALHCSTSIQSIYSHPISLGSILILSSHLHLGLPSGFIPSDFATKISYAFFVGPMRATGPSTSVSYVVFERSEAFLVPYTLGSCRITVTAT